MKNYYLLLIPAAVFFILPVIYGIYRGKQEGKRQRLRDYYKIQERSGRAMSSTSPLVVSRAVDEYQAAYQAVEPILSRHDLDFFKSDMGELRDYLKTVEEDEWKGKAFPHLQNCWDCFYLIREESMDKRAASQTKRRCIAEWQKYFAVPIEQYRNKIYPKRMMREWLGGDYDPCFDSHDALEQKLAGMIAVRQ